MTTNIKSTAAVVGTAIFTARIYLVDSNACVPFSVTFIAAAEIQKIRYITVINPLTCSGV